MLHPATATKPSQTMVIAEIGVNHDGDPKQAENLIHQAAQTGSDAVKFQLFHPDRLLSEQALLASYQKGATSPYDLLTGLKLSLDVFEHLAHIAHSLGLKFILTPFSLEDVDDLAQLPVDFIKIASPDAVNTPLIKRCLALSKPMLVATGTCTLEELYATCQLLRQHPPVEAQHALLHCVSAYPTPMDQAGLHGIQALATESQLLAGYSDHTQSTLTGAMAVCAGACVIEKHLTYDTCAQGPDHAASLAPDAFKQYVDHIRQAQSALGPKTKTPGALEDDVKLVSRQSICMTKDRPAGHQLTADDLTIKRPGHGIPARLLPEMIGKILAKPIAANHLLLAEHLTTQIDCVQHSNVK